MSQNPIVELKEEDRKLLKSAIELLSSQNKIASPPQNPPSEKESAENPWEHVHNCPTCKPKLDKEKEDYANAKFDKDKDNYAKDYTKEYIKNIWKERKDFPFECEDCGTHVRREEEKCPTCGSRKAKSR